MAKTDELTVKGMHCAGCEYRLARSLTGLEGVRDAKADRQAEQVTVTYDPERVSEQDVRERIELAGYEVA